MLLCWGTRTELVPGGTKRCMQEDQSGVEKGTPATGHPEQRCFASLQMLYRKTLKTHSVKYRKIPKISPGAYIFQRPFLRGLFLEGLIYGAKYAFQNRLG